MFPAARAGRSAAAGYHCPDTMATPKDTTPGPVWTAPDLADPHTNPEKARRVRSMFAAVAARYDLNNRLHSLWRDQAWRRRAVREARVRPGEVVLDAACGTGDLTHAFARTQAKEIIGLDFTPQMLELAERKREKLDPAVAGKVRYIEGDATALPLGDGSVEVVSIAFGIRNVSEPARAVAEFARVLRPGGRVVILEFERPGRAPMSWFYDFYCGWLMPRTATLISGDRTGAYRYLPRSVDTFLDRHELRRLLEGAGFTGVRSRGLTGGICVCTVGTKPGE